MTVKVSLSSPPVPLLNLEDGMDDFELDPTKKSQDEAGYFAMHPSSPPPPGKTRPANSSWKMTSRSSTQHSYQAPAPTSRPAAAAVAAAATAAPSMHPSTHLTSASAEDKPASKKRPSSKKHARHKSLAGDASSPTARHRQAHHHAYVPDDEDVLDMDVILYQHQQEIVLLQEALQHIKMERDCLGKEAHRLQFALQQMEQQAQQREAMWQGVYDTFCDQFAHFTMQQQEYEDHRAKPATKKKKKRSRTPHRHSWNGGRMDGDYPTDAMPPPGRSAFGPDYFLPPFYPPPYPTRSSIGGERYDDSSDYEWSRQERRRRPRSRHQHHRRSRSLPQRIRDQDDYYPVEPKQPSSMFHPRRGFVPNPPFFYDGPRDEDDDDDDDDTTSEGMDDDLMAHNGRMMMADDDVDDDDMNDNELDGSMDSPLMPTTYRPSVRRHPMMERHRRPSGNPPPPRLRGLMQPPPPPPLLYNHQHHRAGLPPSLGSQQPPPHHHHQSMLPRPVYMPMMGPGGMAGNPSGGPPSLSFYNLRQQPQQGPPLPLGPQHPPLMAHHQQQAQPPSRPSTSSFTLDTPSQPSLSQPSMNDLAPAGPDMYMGNRASKPLAPELFQQQQIPLGT
ncbi:hypothetical protein DM01DRAFT_1338276 [Hesseltinella vesiculosa]|uniref:Uncharacterized protein n=1 Tax=Hesseltinella vesiculosa TaxID=101127 RepID=A0A1X2GA89_9FUNG|nr:hypothetical protein DM01DRAFT_1338276 [Hesseltinella vesiculosa]